MKGDDALDNRKLSDLSVVGEDTIYPAGHTALDADHTVDMSHTAKAAHHGSSKLGANNSSLNFNPLFGEDEEPGDCVSEGDAEGAIHACGASAASTFVPSAKIQHTTNS